MVFGSSQMSNSERQKVLQLTGSNSLRKIEASIAANIMQRKQLERLLAKYKLTLPLSTNSIKDNRYGNADRYVMVTIDTLLNLLRFIFSLLIATIPVITT